MTYEDATERIKCILKNNSFTRADKNALKLAIEALEKQIPKKPIIIEETEYYFGHTLCPNCEKVEFGFTQPCFCDRCRPAIDWR